MNSGLRKTILSSFIQNMRCFHSKNIHEVLILGVARTPIGSFQKSLSSCSAPELGATAIRGAVNAAGIDPKAVQECYMGMVISAGCKQAPAKQAALKGGLSSATPCTTINKVCASGMKSVMVASLSIAMGKQDVICAGGMESMSNAPFYLPRRSPNYGGVTLHDGILYDGLWDPHYQIHMGQCAEKTAGDFKIGRDAQDNYAKLSYERSQAAAKSGIFKNEIVPVQIPDKKAPNGLMEIIEDEEYIRTDFSRFAKLKPAFVSTEDGGTVTAANASTLSDGAAAIILASASFTSQNKSLKPIAKIVDFTDAALDPIDFSIAPNLAVLRLLKQTGLRTDDIALWEINEAFSVVVLANLQLLNLDINKVNVHGGAVSCGHPVGMSGTRIVGHLALQLKSGDRGIATICNGGGGASAILIERL